MELRWTWRARDDLVAIFEFIARDDPDRARAWIQRIREKARVAAETPLAGRVVPETGREEIRETLLRSYRIVYLVRESAIEVLTVFEGHRLLPGDVGMPDPTS